MERLTIPDEKIDERTTRMTVVDAAAVREHAMEFYWRLKDYENTGLTPKEAKRMSNILMDVGIDYNCSWEYVKNWLLNDRLRELAEADKEGRIVFLPAKMVYELVVDAGPTCDMKCPPAFMDDDGVPCCDFCDKGEIIVNERNCRQDDVRQIGNTVWLTREEAEAALKEVQNGNKTDM